VPALLRPGLGVVVSPLIALMKDQVDALRQAGVRAAALNSRLSPGQVIEVERAVRNAALDLLYVSPERLVTPRCLELLSSVRLGTNLGLIEEVPITTVNELFLHTQPAHLQKLMGSSLDGEERNAARARYLRTRLREHGGSHSN